MHDLQLVTFSLVILAAVTWLVAGLLAEFGPNLRHRFVIGFLVALVTLIVVLLS